MSLYYFEGNGFFDNSVVQNSSVLSSNIQGSSITASSIDMLSTSGNYQLITNVQNPVNDQDAATKIYVDNLGIRLSTVTLINTSGTLISSSQKGTFVITVDNLVQNGPSAVFNVSKNEANLHAHIARTVSCRGHLTDVTLRISWQPGSGISLSKTGGTFDGSYRIKIM